MEEIRFYGRGGQGAVIASWILCYAFFLEGKHAQAFHTFGAERRGAPVEAFVRMDDSFPHLRCKVVNPHYVIVMGDKLVRFVDVTAGIQPKSSPHFIAEVSSLNFLLIILIVILIKDL